MVEPASDRVALVTGASAGIGLETALGLARAGFRVVMAGRDASRAEQARQLVRRAASDRVETALADFTSLAAVRALAATVLARHDRLHVLVNNAGMIAPRHELSPDGYELTIAVNHLAPFLLTNLLLDRLRASATEAAPARVVTVASQAHRGARLDLRTWMDRGRLDPLAGLRPLEAVQHPFHARLGAASGGRRCRRGLAASRRHRDKDRRSAGLAGFGWRLAKSFFASPEKGARTSLFLATTPDPARFHGAYLIDSKPGQARPRRARRRFGRASGPKAPASSGCSDRGTPCWPCPLAEQEGAPASSYVVCEPRLD